MSMARRGGSSSPRPACAKARRFTKIRFTLVKSAERDDRDMKLQGCGAWRFFSFAAITGPSGSFANGVAFLLSYSRYRVEQSSADLQPGVQRAQLVENRIGRLIGRAGQLPVGR